MDQLNQYAESLIEIIKHYAPKLVLAIVVLVVGFWAIKRATRLIVAALTKVSLSQEIISFLGSLCSIGLKVVLVFIVAGLVGIETTSFVAVMAAAGFAVGMALQGSLGNFAAGIIILLFRPYKVNDWVSIKDKFGKVKDIQIFNTLVETPGKNLLIIPNGQVIDDVVTNFSARGFVRLELNVTMPYSESFPRIKQIILNELSKVEVLLKEPEIEIGIDDFDSHNVVLIVRPYCKPDDYWVAKFEANAAIKKAFSENEVSVAYSEGVEMGHIGE